MKSRNGNFRDFVGNCMKKCFYVSIMEDSEEKVNDEYRYEGKFLCS